MKCHLNHHLHTQRIHRIERLALTIFSTFLNAELCSAQCHFRKVYYLTHAKHIQGTNLYIDNLKQKHGKMSELETTHSFLRFFRINFDQRI